MEESIFGILPISRSDIILSTGGKICLKRLLRRDPWPFCVHLKGCTTSVWLVTCLNPEIGTGYDFSNNLLSYWVAWCLHLWPLLFVDDAKINRQGRNWRGPYVSVQLSTPTQITVSYVLVTQDWYQNSAAETNVLSVTRYQHEDLQEQNPSVDTRIASELHP